MSVPLTVLVMAYPRSLPRVEYADEVMKSLKENLIVPDGTRWLCSAEGRVRPELVRMLTRVASRNGFELVWHKGPSHIANHVNHAVARHVGVAPFFHIQEDIKVTRKIDLVSGLKKLDADTLPYIRYYVAEDISSFDREDEFYVYPEINNRKFSHACYLAHPSFFRHHVGPVPRVGGQERVVDQRLQDTGLKVMCVAEKSVEHLGYFSVMGHGCPARPNEAEDLEVDNVDAFGEGARLSTETTDELRKVLRRYKPASIVEWGSGLSTVILSKYCRHHPIVDALSLEHDERFANRTRKAVEESGCNPDIVKLCPLTKPDGFYSYRDLNLNAKRQYELLLIDGPPGARRGQPPAHAFIRQHAGPNTIIIVDDSQRPTEQRLLRLIRNEVLGKASYTHKRTKSATSDGRKKQTDFFVPETFELLKRKSKK